MSKYSGINRLNSSGLELFRIVIFEPLKIAALIKLHDLEFVPFISEETIAKAIGEISVEINKDYKDKTPVFLGILNGAFLVASELIKRFPGACEVSFVKLGSYEGTSTTGNVQTLMGLTQSLEGREVIVIEDIIDTGNTLVEIDRILKEKKVANYKVATLFYKPEAYKKDLSIDYIGMEIPNDFIVGYGLDYDGLGRNLTQVYKLKK